MKHEAVEACPKFRRSERIEKWTKNTRLLERFFALSHRSDHFFARLGQSVLSSDVWRKKRRNDADDTFTAQARGHESLTGGGFSFKGGGFNGRLEESESKKSDSSAGSIRDFSGVHEE
ncbi:MAG: hypothetical protein GWP35_05475 [Proteobacteria bacterium]|jgi:hypothetical protein|nr:hypothetical protein [Pseudomonadota bacterium]